jgi:3-deoxy-D-manno-octulosonic-acid transferase
MNRLFFYTLGVRFYVATIYLFSFWNFKARQWIKGRSLWIEELGKASGTFKDKVVWVHCASLGEFEMARPLMEKIKQEQPDCSILLTFFSPSGYEVRKKWAGADYVMYLPADTPTNAKAFVKMVNPCKAVFVKYEYWLNYLEAMHQANIDTYMVCAVFSKQQVFFKWYGGAFRKALHYFKEIYVQNDSSRQLVSELGIESIVAGDMRFDRVAIASRQNKLSDNITAFSNSGFIIVCGSTWPEEEKIICNWINQASADVKMIIAPHDIGASHLLAIEKQIKIPMVRYSKLADATEDVRVILIDNVGMLASLYKAGKMAVVGGGFSGRLHNILEPAVYGIPVLFGPKHKRFHEAQTLIQAGGAFMFSDSVSFNTLVTQFKNDETLRQTSGKACLHVVSENEGATQLIYDQIF